MPTIEELLVRIDADTERLRRELARSDRSVEQFGRRTDSALARVESRFDRFGSAIARSMGGLVAAFGAQALARDVLETITRFEQLDARLRRLTGGGEAFAEAQAYIARTAQQQSREIGALTDQYAQLLTLQNSGLITQEETRALLEGFGDVAAATGASTAQLNQVMYGLAQALSSGVVRAEELNQVTEPLPGLLQELDKASGVAAGGFRKMVLEGRVTSRVFAETLVRAMQSYQGAAVDMSDNVGAAFQRLENAWTQLKRSLSETPLTTGLSWFLETVTRGIQRVHGLAEEELSVQIVASTRELVKAQDALRSLQERAGDGPMSDLFSTAIDRAQRKVDMLQKQTDDMIERARDHAKRVGELNNAPPVAPPPPPPPSSSRSRGRSEAEKQAEAIARVTEALQFEQEQLMRSARAQAQYNALARAGIDVNHEAAPAIMEAAGAVYDLGEASRLLDEIIQDDAAGLFGRELEDVSVAAEEVADQMRAFGEITSSAFEDAILNGKELKDVLGGLLQDLARMGLRSASNSLFGVIGEALGFGGASSALDTSIASNPDLFGFGGGGALPGGSGTDVLAFAGGGNPPVGRWSLVGERGPELIMPKTPTTVFSNPETRGMLGGGGVQPVNVVTNIDARGATPDAVAALRREMQERDRRLPEIIRANTIDARRRLGPMERAFRGA